MKPSDKKAFAYLRVSSEGQVEGDGLTRQRKAIEAYAKAHGIKIVRWFEEKGVSGTIDGADRPAFSEMLVALLSNGVRAVLIEKLDRIARDILIQESTIREFQRKGFELVSVCEPDLCSKDPNRIAMRQMLGVFAQLDRANIVTKLRAARQRVKARTGCCEGRKPFGYRDGEQDTLKRIITMHTDGNNFEQIAKVLNSDGIAPRSGKLWYPATVRGILLRNEAK
jgi:DNA invertase Pin-like site-specific DNA recombinase